MHTVVDIATMTDETIKRSDILADDKIQVEDVAEDEKICLGWILNTRSLQITIT